jgi:outer membrane murein-binding lipoprotein Lpp
MNAAWAEQVQKLADVTYDMARSNQVAVDLIESLTARVKQLELEMDELRSKAND